MATKAAAKAAPKKAASKSTAVTVWEQQMADAAKKQAAAAVPTGIFKQISTRGGILSVDDTPIKGNELRVVVLVTCHENQYYDTDFDPSTPQVPVCYAFSEPDASDDDMAPHEKCRERQCESCGDCENNVMGSAQRGKGKACKNVMRLALVTEDALESADAMEEAEVRMLKVPVTSVKNWSKYINTLSDEMSRPSWGVVTRIYLMPDPKSQFKVCFEFEELINFDQTIYDQIQKRIAEVSKDIVAPYPDMEEQPAAKPARGKAAAKPAAKGKAASKRY